MPLEQNSYVVWLQGHTDAIVFDPGLEPELILDVLREEGLTAAALICTHGHFDHIGGNSALKKAYPSAPLIIGVGDVPMLSDAVLNLSVAFGLPITSPPADQTVREGEELLIAGMRFEIYEIPGHSHGHVVFVLRGEPTRIFGGDVLFRGGIGRSDFPGGSGRQLLSGIRQKLFKLPEDAVVYPGHGPTTTIGHEKATNPYLT